MEELEPYVDKIWNWCKETPRLGQIPIWLQDASPDFYVENEGIVDRALKQVHSGNLAKMCCYQVGLDWENKEHQHFVYFVMSMYALNKHPQKTD